MRIVYLHQYFRTPAMGGGTRSYEFARRLAASGHEVNVVTSDTGEGAGWRVSEEAGVTVHWAGVEYRNSMSYSRRIRAFGEFAWVAAQRAASLDQDVVFATSTPLTIALPAIHSAHRHGVPMVFEVRDLWPDVPIALGALRSPVARFTARQLERLAYRKAASIIALSPAMAEGVRARRPDVPVTVIPNSCDVDMFGDADRAGRLVRERTPWLGDRPLLVYAGTFGLVNDVRYIVRMAAVLRDIDPEVRIALVGQGGEESAVRDLASRLGVLDTNLFMLGHVPKTEIVGWLGAADLSMSTVLNRPQLHANSANKVFDAFAAGRPVAVNHEGWLADLLRETGAGVVFPADEPGRAAVQAHDFVRDPARTTAARRAAATLAADRFNRDTLYTAFENVLLDAVGGTRVPAVVPC